MARKLGSTFYVEFVCVHVFLLPCHINLKNVLFLSEEGKERKRKRKAREKEDRAYFGI